MKTYIVMCGDYDYSHNALVTGSYEDALNYALKCDETSIYDAAEVIECWEDGKLLYDFGSYQRDARIKRTMSFEDLDSEIKSHIVYFKN